MAIATHRFGQRFHLGSSLWTLRASTFRRSRRPCGAKIMEVIPFATSRPAGPASLFGDTGGPLQKGENQWWIFLFREKETENKLMMKKIGWDVVNQGVHLFVWLVSLVGRFLHADDSACDSVSKFRWNFLQPWRFPSSNKSPLGEFYEALRFFGSPLFFLLPLGVPLVSSSNLS